MSDSPARVAADVAALYPADHPLAVVARGRLAAAASTEQVSAPLRDASVEPLVGGPFAPLNAGIPGPEGNPHGPSVTSIQVGTPEYEHIDTVRRVLLQDGVTEGTPAWGLAIHEARERAAQIIAKRRRKHV